jgi:hypothetical protein
MAPPNGATINDDPVVTWSGYVKTTTITTHALASSESVQDLAP